MTKRKNWKSPYWIATRGIGFNKDLRYDLDQSVLDLLYEMAEVAGIWKNWTLMEEAFSCLLGNLFHAYIVDEPIFYSRSPNAFSIERKRYGYDFYRYALIVRLVDVMYEYGLLKGVKGRKVRNGRNRPSKMWATKGLMDLFADIGGSVFIKRNPEVLHLKNDAKQPIDFPETSMVREKRNRIIEINEMLGALKITFGFRYEHLSDRPQARVNKLMKLRSLALSGQILLPDNNIIIPTHQEISQWYSQNRKANTRYYTDFDYDAFLLRHYKGLWLTGEINPEANQLRRIFNVDWHHGGRYYHAPHITMPSSCRDTFTINGEPCVELDYSGLHIRMLYHRIGIDYRDECYVYDKEDDEHKDERERIKLASLIVINSKDRDRAIKAIHNQCRKKGLHYPAGQYGRYSALADAFEEFHLPISKFLLTGQGLGLQYLDSTIMSAILRRMTTRGIPALPVHDSVICPTRHEDYLRQVMVEEYEKVMGFKPKF